MRIARFVTIWAALGCLVGLYVAWPYWSAHQLRQAIETSDVVVLNRKVAWVPLRASLKEMLAAEMMRDMAKKGIGSTDAEKFGTGLAAVLGPAMVDRMVDSFVTPQGLLTFLSSSTRGQFMSNNDFVRRAGFSSPTRFEIEFGMPSEPKPRLVAVLELTDFDWKLTQLLALTPLNS